MIPKVLKENILISIPKKEEKMSKGVILPDSIQTQENRTAKVEAVGERIKQIKVGDQILITGYGLREVKWEDKVYYITNLDNILAVLPHV